VQPQGRGSAAAALEPAHAAKAAQLCRLPEAAWGGGLLSPVARCAGWELSTGARAAAGAWLARTDAGSLGTRKLHSQPWHHFLCHLCHVSSCAERGHGVRLSLSLPIVQAHCRAVLPCPAQAVPANRLLLQWVRKNGQRVILSCPVKGKGDSSLAMKFFSLQKFPASICFCSLSLSQPEAALRDAALPQDSAAR